MKKLWLITLTLIMALTLCFGLTACGDKTVEQLQNELGAILEGGSFKEGSVFNVNDITAEKATEILGKLEDNGITIDDEAKAYIYDIFVTKDNAEVQPDGKVKVTVPMPDDEKAEGYNVYHIKDSGAIEAIPSTYNDGKVSFETDSFSWYVFTPTYNTEGTLIVPYPGVLYVGCNLSDGVVIHSNYKPLTEYSPVVSKGAYLVGEETTLELQINNQNHTFLGWYEAESFYLGNYEKPVLKDTPVSTEITYTFTTDKNEYAVYAVFAEKGGKIHFNVGGNGGVITINGEPIEPNYTDDFKVGKSYALTAEAYEGYRFAGWSIYGEMSYSFVEEASFSLVTKADEKNIVAKFEPVVTDIVADVNGSYVYDPNLGAALPDFAGASVYSVTPEGTALLASDAYTVDLGGLDATKPGTYTVTYTYNENTNIKTTATVTVLAESVTVTVENDGRGGTAVQLGENRVEKGSEVTLNAETYGEEFVFLGWFTESGAQLSAELEYTFTANESTVILARFKAKNAAEVKVSNAVDEMLNSTEIQVYVNGENANRQNVEYFIGQLLTLEIRSVPDHLTFLGWYERDAGSNMETPEDMAPVLKKTALSTDRRFEYEITSDKVEIYAVFVNNGRPFYVNASHTDAADFKDGNGESVELPLNEDLVLGKTYTFTAEIKAGYEFVGWHIGETYDYQIKTDATITYTTNLYSREIWAEFKPVVTGISVDMRDVEYRPETGMQMPDFASAKVYAISADGTKVLTKDVDYTVDLGGLDVTKAGEYTVTYTYVANPEFKATVTVKVFAQPVEFSAYMSVDGTFLLDGVEIGPDYYEVFSDGFGKVTLTAKAEEGTKFKGWYTARDNNPTLISTDATYTFEFNESTYVYADFEYLATEIWLDGINMGFDTEGGITEIWLPVQGTYDPNLIRVFAIINGEREALTADEYTIDLGGFNGTNPAKGDYVLTFTYKANPELKATHIIRVIDEENMVNFSASSAAGGRVTVDKPYGQFNKGEQVTVTVELRSESDYEFLGWYTVDASGAVGTTCVSTERTYTVTLNENTSLYAKVEPKITRLEVEGLEENPTKIPLAKFEAYEYLFAADRGGIYACGALGKRVELTANDYTVDMGGLIWNENEKPAVGKYTLTYTYKADTSITYTVTVWVYDADYTFSADQDSPNGWLLFEGDLTQEVQPYQYVSGEEITITAAAKEGYTFLGWYLEINKETHCEYELLSTDATYTFTINKDTKLQAKFGAPVTEIDLVGVNQNNNGDYAITIYSGEMIDLSYISVYAYSLIDAGFLSTDEYAIDFGGLDTADPVAGVYTVTYTYKDEGELTDIKITLTVNVIKRSFYVNASVAADGGSGYIEYNGNRDRYVSDMLEEGTRITLKAVEYDAQNYVFVRWEAYDYENDVWEIYSTDRTISFAVEGDMKLRAVFGGIVSELRIHAKTNLYDKGVYHWNFDGILWNEELGRYEGLGDLEISIDSEYVSDIEGLFANFNIVAVETNGRHTVIEASDLVIDLGDYKAEEGWYEITVSYGSFTMTVNVMVVSAYN